MFPIKKIFLNSLFNFFLFLILIIMIQNSSNKNKVDLIVNETIELPISFIIGTSFITGSFIGSFLKLNRRRNKE